MGLRIFDIISDRGIDMMAINTLLSNSRGDNLGGGYSATGPGQLVMNTDSVTLDAYFPTDYLSTGYQKFQDTMSNISNNEVVWLRYAIPISEANTVGGEYYYVYKPGYISNLTKGEASGANQSLKSELTITPYSTWQELYQFGPDFINGIEYSLAAQDAYRNPTYQILSDYLDHFKKVPYNYPYWYKSIIEDIDGWYNSWGNVLDPNNDDYRVFAIHAPKSAISPIEETALTIYGNNAITGSNSHENSNRLSKPINRATGSKNLLNFSAPLENYSVLPPLGSLTPSFGGAVDFYSSFVISGTVLAGQTGEIQFIGTVYDDDGHVVPAVVNRLGLSAEFSPDDAYFLIDTAEWANTYNIIGYRSRFDFSQYTSSNVSANSKLKITGGVIVDSVIARRSIVGG